MIERANGEIHAIRREREQLDRREQEWLTYRERLRDQALADAKRQEALAARVAQARGDAPAGPAPVPAVPAPGPAALAPRPTAADAWFAAPTPPAAAVPTPAAVLSGGWRVETPAQEQTNGPARAATNGPADASASPTRERRPSAALLLGISGAAAIIVSGIIFVAASWGDYGPPARMAIMLAFAAAFAFLSVLTARHDFGTVAGSLGVVSAAFVGVSVIAVRFVDDALLPYAWPGALLATAVASRLLHRIGIAGTAGLSAVAFVLAVHGCAVEVGLRSVGIGAGLGRYAIAAALGAAFLRAFIALWNGSLLRAIIEHGASIAAALAVVAAAMGSWADAPLALRIAAALASLAVASWIAVARSPWLAGLVSAASWCAVIGIAAAAEVEPARLALMGAAAAVTQLLLTELVPPRLRAAWLTGLVPGALAVVVAWLTLAAMVIAGALVWVNEPSPIALANAWWLTGVVGVALGGCFGARALRSLERLRPTLDAAGGSLAIVATLALATLPLAQARLGSSLVCAAWLLAAIVQWLAAPLWGATQEAFRVIAIGVATAAAIYGIGAAAAETGMAGLVAACGLLLAIAWLFVAGSRQPGAWIIAGLLIPVGVTAVTWRLAGSGDEVMAIAACAVALQELVVWAVPSRRWSRWLAGATLVHTGVVVAVAALTSFAVSVALMVNLGNLDGDRYAWSWLPLVAGVATAAIACLRLRPRGARPVPFQGPWHAAATMALIGLAAVGVDAAQRGLGGGSLWLAALASAAAGLAFGLTVVPPLRGTMRMLGIAATAFVSLAAGVELLLGFGDRDEWLRLASVGVAVLALGAFAIRWPLVTLGPAVALAGPVVMAASNDLPRDAWATVAVTVVAVLAWALMLAARRLRLAIGIGALTSVAFALWSVTLLLGLLVRAWAGSVAGAGTDWRPWQAAQLLVLVAGALAFRVVRARAVPVAVAVASVVPAFLPGGVGWGLLAVAVLALIEPAVRLRGRAGLSLPLVSVASAALLLWTPPTSLQWAVSLTVTAVAHVALVLRSTVPALMAGWSLAVASISAGAAAAATAAAAGLGWPIAAVSCVVLALIVATGAAVVREDVRSVGVVLVAAVSIMGPLTTHSLAASALVVLAAVAAWYALSTLGVPYARKIAMWGLTPAAAFMAASLQVSAWEAYTAVPAVTLLVTGLLWMARDGQVRSYRALAPGLAVGLLPSYAAVLALPGVWVRIVVLLLGATFLASAGVALRWFAPLLATAITVVFVALTQIIDPSPVVPLWAAITVIGVVLLVLALLAERIRTMR